MLDIFTWPHDGSVSLMSGSYHVGLVALSLLIAVAISCMAMQIVGIARSSGGYHRQLALVTGALALGAGIWSMHFIGMLAFRLCTPVRYDWTITLLSIIPAIIASRVALGLLMRDVVSVRLFGWADKELLGQPITMLLPAEYWSEHAAYLCQHVSAGIVKVIGSGREARAVRQDGSLFPIRLAVSKVQFREQTLLVCFMTDITEQKRIESLLERDALHDALTDLPNRRALFVILPQAIARAERARSSFALLFIDLDGFKAINDSLGHECGDRLLKVVAGTLMQSARHSDFVVRLAGDEFVMLLEGVHDEGEARVFAEKLLLALGRPVQLDGHVLRVQASIGIAFFRPGRHIEAEALLREADEAMYAAKKQGKGGVFVVLDSGRSKVAQPG